MTHSSSSGSTSPSLLDQALEQIGRVETLCTFTDIQKYVTAQGRRTLAYLGIASPSNQTNLPGVPPPQITQVDPLAAKTLDTAMWHGLGTVGLMASIDAFRERKGKRKGDFGRALSASQHVVLGELDDLRNLFAHNLAGNADSFFFQKATSRVHPRFQSGVTLQLLS